MGAGYLIVASLLEAAEEQVTQSSGTGTRAKEISGLNARVHRFDGSTVELPISIGTPLFIVGANGSGKSSLMHTLIARHPDISVRIFAHRQNWLQSNTVPFSPLDKVQNETTLRDQDMQPRARWSDWNPNARAALVLANLLEADNVISREIRDKLKSGDHKAAVDLTEQLPPLDIISELLKGAGIPISLSIVENGSIVASKRSGPHYSVASLSDGERSALLTAGTILTAAPGSIIFVDEPEQHLHPSIVTPLLLQLFDKRRDCAFVISTHELSLPIEGPDNRTVIVRDSKTQGDTGVAWDLDVLGVDDELDDRLKETILGSRRRVLFVEGNSSSLDRPFYELLFPDISVSPQLTCGDVVKCVDGVRASAARHWVSAFGIIDQDQVGPDKRASLSARGIYPLSVYSVEGLYYHPRLQLRVAQRQASVIGGDPDALLEKALDAFLIAIAPHVDRLAARMTEQAVKDAISVQMPDWRTVAAGGNVAINVDSHAMLAAEKQRLDGLIRARDVAGIIARYPVRETPALRAIVSTLGFKDRNMYEAAVRKLIADDIAVRAELLGFLGEVATVLSV